MKAIIIIKILHKFLLTMNIIILLFTINIISEITSAIGWNLDININITIKDKININQILVY